MSGAAKTRYLHLATLRQPFLDRARFAATLTLPSLVPPEGHPPGAQLPQPNQGLGARLVIHLASYFTSALLPPGRQFFRLGVSPKVLLKSGKQAVPSDVEAGLSLVERIPHLEVERRAWRAPTGVSLQHLMVSGNVMERMLPDNTLMVYPLDRFVVVRDPNGKLIEFIIEDPLDGTSLPDNLKALQPTASDSVPGAQRYCLYTWGKLEDGVWKVHQEFVDSVVTNTEGKYDPDVLPYFALRWSLVAGEDYGRGKVEEHIADLTTFDGLSKAVRDGSAMASRNVILIRPNAAAGVNLRRKLASANNGDMIVGNPDDVQMLQFTNTNGLAVVQQELAALKTELGAAFMLTSSVIRDAERVTADEVRRVSQELDSAQGGAYSMLSQEMLKPRLDRLLHQMIADGELPAWPKGVVEPTILTGLEAMGREADTSNVINGLSMLKGYPPDVYDYLNWPVLLKKGFTSLDLADAVRSDDEVAQIRQQRMDQQTQQQAITSAAAPVAQAAAQAATA